MADDEILQHRANRPVIRTGAMVTHPVQPWTPAIHALLNYLEQAGFPYSPRVLGTEDGSEILTYIEGDSGPEGWARVVDEQGLRTAARLLRTYHDIVAQWKPDQDPVWFTGQTGTGFAGEIVCHGDFAPWNIVWHGTTPVGLLDWEYANLAPARQDIAYALEYMAPFRDDQTCIESMRYSKPPDRRRRLEVFAEAYGLPSTDGLVDDVIAVQQAGVDTVRRMAEQGHERQIAMVQAGELDHLQACVPGPKNTATCLTSSTSAAGGYLGESGVSADVSNVRMVGVTGIMDVERFQRRPRRHVHNTASNPATHATTEHFTALPGEK